LIERGWYHAVQYRNYAVVTCTAHMIRSHAGTQRNNNRNSTRVQNVMSKTRNKDERSSFFFGFDDPHFSQPSNQTSEMKMRKKRLPRVVEVGFVQNQIANLGTYSCGAVRAAQCGHFGNVQTRPHAYLYAYISSHDHDHDSRQNPFFPGGSTIVLCLPSFVPPFAVHCPKIYRVVVAPTSNLQTVLFRLWSQLEPSRHKWRARAGPKERERQREK
jgi:hypothetical protein